MFNGDKIFELSRPKIKKIKDINDVMLSNKVDGLLSDNDSKQFKEVVKKFDAFENKTTCSINIPSGISLKNDTGKYQTYLLSLNNYCGLFL